MNTDQKNKLKAFAASSNWSMLLSHPSDKQNWEKFMAAAKASPDDIADGEVYGVIKGTATNPCPDDIAGKMEYMCRRGKQGRIKRFVAGVKEAMKGLFGFACLMMPFVSSADIKVSDVEVFSGYPWKEVVVGYTITGTTTEMDIVRLTATDKSANKTYIAWSPTGAVLNEGRHVLRWNAAAEGSKFSSANVVFSVSIVPDGVQLWANGPYWAEFNVGATRPEEFGYYFWWGDTVGYKRNPSGNGWVSVKDGSSFSFSSANCPAHGKSKSELLSMNYIDSKGNLNARHDAARAHCGAPWRMPTSAEISALIDNCDIEWIARNGVNGHLVTGRGAYASKSIFFPAGFYWSATETSAFYSFQAWHLVATSDGFGLTGRDRYHGQSVRPVRELAK